MENRTQLGYFELTITDQQQRSGDQNTHAVDGQIYREFNYGEYVHWRNMIHGERYKMLDEAMALIKAHREETGKFPKRIRISFCLDKKLEITR